MQGDLERLPASRAGLGLVASEAGSRDPKTIAAITNSIVRFMIKLSS